MPCDDEEVVQPIVLIALFFEVVDQPEHPIVRNFLGEAHSITPSLHPPFTKAAGISFEDKPDLVTNATESIDFGFTGAHSVGRILKSPMVAIDFPGKGRAGLVGIAADGDDRADARVEKLIKVF